METRNSISQEKMSELIQHLMTAISSCGLYSVEHPVVREFSERALGIIRESFAGDTLNIAVIGESVMFDDTPCLEKGTHISGFIRRLRKKKIDKIIVRKTPDIAELTKFVVGMASREKVTATPHISVGIIEIRVRGDDLGAAALLDSGIAKVKDVFLGASHFRKLDMVGLEDAVIDFLATLKKELNILRVVSPVKSHNEYTYVHATNVSVLTLFQAESLGLKGETLRDIGLAGLLHDVGKMFVSNFVLDKQGKLDAGEWNDIKTHPVHGALYLAKLPEVPSLASIVAFEHHMKYDGTGYPDTRRIGRKQHIISQMVAIADFFDALRTERPYRKPLEVPVILGMMKEATGKDFNPMLTENFISALSQVSNSSG